MTRRKKKSGLLPALLGAAAAFLCVLGITAGLLPDALAAQHGGFRTEAVLPVSGTAEERLLYPGGMLFGVRCATAGVLVIGFEDVDGHACPAKAAGLRQGDLITAAEGEPVGSVSALAERISACGAAGIPVHLTVSRQGAAEEITVQPVCGADGRYRAGIWSRDSAAGIGTVTFIDPETGLFGGLGHGICDTDTGTLLPLARGMTLDVTVSEIVRGSAGVPGELRGCLDGRRTGSLTDNTPAGVFGIFSAVPAAGDPVPVGRADSVREGKAEILCSLDGGDPAAYEIEIVRLAKPGDGKTGGGRGSFLIEITDRELLRRTGGIIQGMSGSPILQDGRLIGAVTHVLVNHPERGYGIPIETMLDAAG